MQELFLDIETSGTDPVKHSILSIGIVISLNGLEDFQSFYREVKYAELIISPQAIEVNDFDFTHQTGRLPVSQVDKEAIKFVNKYYHAEDHPVPIGLNIGSFDMQFINRQMPLLTYRLSHRSVDLNSLIYILAEKHSKAFKELKRELSDKAHLTVNSLALGVKQHNAFYDAVFNLSLYLLIRNDILNL